MSRPAVSGLLVLLFGCGAPFSPVQAPAPREIPENSTVRIWTRTGDQVVRSANIRHDSLIGMNPPPSGPVGQTLVAIPLRDIDSLRLMREQAAETAVGPFMAGFAIGAVLLWAVFFGGNDP